MRTLSNRFYRHQALRHDQQAHSWLLPLLSRLPLLNKRKDGLARFGEHRLHAELSRLEQLHAGDGRGVDGTFLDIAVDEERSMGFEVGGPDDVVLRVGQERGRREASGVSAERWVHYKAAQQAEAHPVVWRILWQNVKCQ